MHDLVPVMSEVSKAIANGARQTAEELLVAAGVTIEAVEAFLDFSFQGRAA